jgi:hypothetical protein
MREQHLDDVVLRGVLAQYVMVVKMFGHGDPLLEDNDYPLGL